MLTDLFRPMHLFVILVIALMIFGPRKLPELGSSLGKAIRDFRSCFFSADESKRVNCVSGSAAVQHIETPIKSQQ